jgi:glycosyltransferase involved in cell wall biosynthesis
MSERVSVAMAVYNGEKSRRETLDSIRRQDYDAIGIVLLDNGSTDGTAAIVQSYPASVRYFYQDNRGQASALNRGFPAARWAFIGVVAADDLWAVNKLALQLPPLVQNDDRSLSWGRLQRFWCDSEGEHRYLAPERAMSFLTGLFRADLFRTVGSLGEGVAPQEYDWFMRAWEQEIPMYVHGDVVGYYRRHGGNRSNLDPTGNDAVLNLLKKALRRRRRQGQENSLRPLEGAGDGATGHDDE